MNTITLPTTLHCKGCVASIRPFFDASPKIKSWNVDLAGNPTTITAAGEQLKAADVEALLEEAGYEVIKQKSTTSSALPPIGKKEEPFWNDKMKWRRAAFNTLNCLIGCSIGDFGAVVVMQGFFPGTPMWAQMAIAVVSGLCTSISLETILLKIREKFDWQSAVSTALSMSLLSMITMETAMNTSDFLITGGKSAFTKPQYWIAFAIASVVGFLIPLPYNYYKLKKYNQACH
jgi:cation transport ATPase